MRIDEKKKKGENNNMRTRMKYNSKLQAIEIVFIRCACVVHWEGHVAKYLRSNQRKQKLVIFAQAIRSLLPQWNKRKNKRKQKQDSKIESSKICQFLVKNTGKNIRLKKKRSFTYSTTDAFLIFLTFFKKFSF